MIRPRLEERILAELRFWPDLPVSARMMAGLLGTRSIAEVAAVLVRLVDERRIVEMERGPLSGYTLHPRDRDPIFRIRGAAYGYPLSVACERCGSSWSSTPANEGAVLAELVNHRCKGEPCPKTTASTRPRTRSHARSSSGPATGTP